MKPAKADVSGMLREEAAPQEHQSIRQQLREANKRQEQPRRSPKEREQER